MDKKSTSYKTRSCVTNGSAAAKARAKAEAAKARLAYAQKEMALKLEKAKVEASMDMLNYEKETAAAIAEAEVLEAACDLESEKHSFKLKLDSMPSLEALERTEQYVVEQAKAAEARIQMWDDQTSIKVGQDPTYNKSIHHPILLYSHLALTTMSISPSYLKSSFNTIKLHLCMLLISLRIHDKLVVTAKMSVTLLDFWLVVS